MKLGDFADITRSFSARNIADFTVLAPVVEHANAVPEPLIAALFSYLLGVRLPGPGTNYLKQSLAFHAAAPLDEPLTARVEITRLRPEKRLVDLRTTCHDSAGRLLADGRALVLAKDVGGYSGRR